MKVIESWYSVEEIARHLGVSKEMIYKWLDRKAMPAHRFGKLWRFKPTEVDDWLMGGGGELEFQATSAIKVNSHG